MQNDEIERTWVLLATLPALWVYFLPTVIACKRGLRLVGCVFIVNAVFGLSGVGWIGCLVWSFAGKTYGQAKDQNRTLSIIMDSAGWKRQR